MKKAKKGFTIVELVVVIAVIAILAAVLIPTFISIVNRAKVSNDNQLVRNLNTALITEEADGNKAENMSQAIAIAEDYGYKLENLQAKADGYVLLWNQITNRFYVESAEGTITSNPEVTDFPAENYTYWEISKTLSTKHSTYLTEGSGNIAATNLGVDVSGISSAVNVTYTGNENKVIIATNGGDLSVNAGTGHVAHYGFVKNLTVTAVNGADCYREHGYVGTLATFGTGKFVAEKGSQFHQTEEQIKTAVNPESNTFVDLGATYGVHKRDENGICVICNDGGTPSVKNGLVDGYYYKDDVLYTGTETDNGTTYTFENGRLVVKADDSLNSDNDINKVYHNFDKSAIDSKYLTDDVILLSYSAICNSPGLQSYVRNYFNIQFDGYSMSEAKAYSPEQLKGMSDTPWTLNTLNEYIKVISETCGNDVYSDINAYPYYEQGKDYDDYSALNTSSLTFGEYLKLKYRNNTIVTGESSAISAYFVKQGDTEKISAYAYRNVEQGVGIVIGSTGTIYGYVWSEKTGCYPTYKELKEGENTFSDSYTPNYTIEKNGNVYTVKYNGTTLETLSFTMSTITDYNLAIEKENIIGKSIYNECSSEELLAIVTMPGNKTQIKIVDDPEIAELYLKAFWKQYWIKVVDSSIQQKFDYDLSEITKESFNSTNFYYVVYFSNGIANAYQDMDHTGPVIRIVLSKNA